MAGLNSSLLDTVRTVNDVTEESPTYYRLPRKIA